MSAITVFFCYAHQDQGLRDELEKHLDTMKRQNQITTWYDGDISAGAVWETEIRAHLEEATIILLLISPDFMHSNYSYGQEMQRALQRHKNGEARVIPILLRSVDWAGAPFSKLQLLPKDGRPVMTWEDRDEAFTQVAKEIRKITGELLISQVERESFQDYIEKRYKEALTLYNQAIEFDPENVQAYTNKGAALYGLAQYEEALQAFKKAEDLDSENASICNGKGKVLYALQAYNEALFAQEEAIRIDPDLAEAYRDKAIVLETLAMQAHNRADEIEHKHTNEQIHPLLQAKDASLMRLGEMIRQGKVHTNDRVYVNREHASGFATIIDGRTVDFQGKRIRINEWARKQAHWSSINIYDHVYLERTQQPLKNLREEE